MALDSEMGVICYDKGDSHITKKNAESYPGHEKIQWTLLGKPDFFEKLFPVRFLLSYIRSFRKFDLVSIHGAWLPVLVVAGLVAGIAKKPYVVVPHGMIDAWALSQGKVKKFVVWHLVWRGIMNRARLIRALTEYERCEMQRLGVAAPIEVISNGVFKGMLHRLHRIDEQPWINNDLANLPKPYVLFLGRLHYKKGLDILIRAFEMVFSDFPRLHLVVAGPDEGVLADALEMIGDAGLSDSFHYVGPVYSDDKYRLLKGASCFCLPSRQEGFSMAVLDAMAAGCPIVITTECHFDQLAGFGGGVVVSTEFGAVARALQGILNDPQMASSMGEKAKIFLSMEYTWETLSLKYGAALRAHVEI